MKSTTQSTEPTTPEMPAAKESIGKGKSKAKRGSARRRASTEMGRLRAGSRKQKKNLFGRSKSALRAASGWAEASVKQLPAAARKLDLPGQRVAVGFVEQKPLIVGAVGFGIGLVAGALLPRMSGQRAARRRK